MNEPKTIEATTARMAVFNAAVGGWCLAFGAATLMRGGDVDYSYVSICATLGAFNLGAALARIF